MNKLFKSIVAASVGVAMAIGVGVGAGREANAVYAEEEVCYTLEPVATGGNGAPHNSYTAAATTTIDNVEWSVTGNSSMVPWRIGGKSISNVDREIYSMTALSDNITKIDVTHGTATDITLNSWTVIVSKNSDFSNPVSTLTPTFTASASTTVNRPDGADWSNCYFKFVYNVTVTGNSNKFVQFSGADFYKEVGGQVGPTKLAKPQPSYSDGTITWEAIPNASSYDLVVDGGTVVHEAESPYTLGTLSSPAAHTVTVTAIGDGTSYSTSDAGSTTFYLFSHAGTEQDPYDVANARLAIDANQGVTGVYVAGIVSYVKGFYSNKYITYRIVDNKNDENYIEAYNGLGLDGADFNSIDDIVIDAVVVIRGNLSKYNSSYQLGANNVLISYDIPDNKLADPVPSYSYSENEITWAAVPNASSYNLSIDGGTAILNVTSPYKLGDFDTPSGHIVTVTAIGDGNSYLDSNPGVVGFAFFEDGKSGTAAEPYDIANAKAAIDGNTGITGVYVSGIISQIDSYNSQYSSITYWISDDGTTANQFEVYSGKDLNQANFSSKDDIVVGASVVVCGDIKLHSGVYEFDKNNYLVEYTEPAVVEHTVTFMSDGAVYSTQTVAEGGVATLPSPAPAKEGYTFDGWFDESLATQYSFSTPVTGDLTLYAKWTKTIVPVLPEITDEGSFVKITSKSRLYSGAKYLIVYEDGPVAFDGSLETLDAVEDTVGVTISNSNIAKDSVKSAFFTITKSGDEYTIQSASGYYVGQTSDTNGLASDKTNAYLNDISFDDDGNATIVSGGAYLRYNSASNQLRFRYYKSSSYTNQKAIQLYKFVPTFDDYLSSATAIKTIRGNVTVENGQITAANSISLRFGVKIPAANWDAITALGYNISEYGIKMFLTNNANTESTVAGRIASGALVAGVSASATPNKDGQDNYNLLAAVNIPDDEADWPDHFSYDSYFCVRPYVIIDGETYWLLENDMHESVKTLAANNDGTNLSKAALDLLAA